MVDTTSLQRFAYQALTVAFQNLILYSIPMPILLCTSVGRGYGKVQWQYKNETIVSQSATSNLGSISYTSTVSMSSHGIMMSSDLFLVLSWWLMMVANIIIGNQILVFNSKIFNIHTMAIKLVPLKKSKFS